MDWAGQPHWHSISGYLFHIGQGAVTWSSKKQYIIALLSTELEYITLVHATKEGLWMHTFLSEIQDVLGCHVTLMQWRGTSQCLLEVVCWNIQVNSISVKLLIRTWVFFYSFNI